MFCTNDLKHYSLIINDHQFCYYLHKKLSYFCIIGNHLTWVVKRGKLDINLFHNFLKVTSNSANKEIIVGITRMFITSLQSKKGDTVISSSSIFDKLFSIIALKHTLYYKEVPVQDILSRLSSTVLNKIHCSMVALNLCWIKICFFTLITSWGKPIMRQLC